MEAIAKARFQRVSPRKARKVLDVVRGKAVADALSTLKHLPNAGAEIVYKALDSAVSNAQDRNPKVDLDNLCVRAAFADEAPNQHMRRWRPRAQGRATRIVKGMSHITVVVSDDVRKR